MSYRVLYVGEHNALAVSERLEEVHAEPNVPTQRVVSVKRGRKIEHEQAIIEGYVFARRAVRVRGVVNVLQSDGHDATVSDAEVDAIAARPATAQGRYRKGAKIAVVSGPFTGFTGTITELRKRGVTAELVVFGRPTPVQLGFDQVEPA